MAAPKIFTNRKDSKFERIIAYSIITVVGIVFLSTISPLVSPAQGQHTGYITSTEIANAYLVFPNNVAYIKSELESSQEEAYCVKDDETLQRLREAQTGREKVTVLYKNGYWMPPWICGLGASIIYDLTSQSQ